MFTVMYLNYLFEYKLSYNITIKYLLISETTTVSNAVEEPPCRLEDHEEDLEPAQVPDEPLQHQLQVHWYRRK